jgi:hypothetical protein
MIYASVMDGNGEIDSEPVCQHPDDAIDWATDPEGDGLDTVCLYRLEPKTGEPVIIMDEADLNGERAFRREYPRA